MSPQTKKILVVDDDAGTVKLVQAILNSGGYGVVTASDGLEALNKVKKERPDLVVLDVMMPEINGYDVCYQLRFNKDYEKIPIILLTVRNNELAKTIGDKANIEYLPKPVNASMLLTKVQALLAKKQ